MAAPMTNPAEGANKEICCCYCGKTFRNRSGLNDHERGHRGSAPYKCCSKMFFSKANLQRHQCRCHGENRQYACPLCSNRFPLAADLRKHQETFHKDPAFKCNICTLKLRTKERLSDHLDKHHDEKRHRCECGKFFRYAGNLTRHKKTCGFVKT